MKTLAPITLASGSAIRAKILKSRGIDFEVVKPGVDETVIKTEAAAAGIGLEETAMKLAEAKCLAVAKSRKGFVIASDQILEFEDRPYDKPASIAEAKARIAEMQGRTHSLINATALAHDGEIVWRNLSRPRLTMKAMTPADIDAYFDAVGEEVLSSVGAYMVETRAGAALFERISGDWYAVQGLAADPLLAEQKRRGAFGDEWKNPPRILAGVVGSPIAHSLSPLIHNEWAKRACIDGEYRAIEAPPGYDAFSKTMDDLRAQGFAGVNVTIPHKENALHYATTASPVAKKIGAANMLTFSEDGAHAHSSDGVGFLSSLADIAIPGDPVRVFVLGAGGAARAVASSCRDLTAGETPRRPVEIFIANRTAGKAEDIAENIGATIIPWTERSACISTMSIVVNTTSLGMTGEPPLDLDLSDLSPDAIVSDIVYAPLETPLLKAARARGNVALNGLEMLLWQAVPGFEAWFGNRPYPVVARVDDDLRDLLIAELKKRSAP